MANLALLDGFDHRGAPISQSASSASPSNNVWRWAKDGCGSAANFSVLARGWTMANQVLADVPLYGDSSDAWTLENSRSVLSDDENGTNDAFPDTTRVKGELSGAEVRRAARHSINTTLKAAHQFYVPELQLNAFPSVSAEQTHNQNLVESHFLHLQGPFVLSGVSHAGTPTTTMSAALRQTTPKSPPTPIPNRKSTHDQFAEPESDSFDYMSPDPENMELPEAMADVVGAFLPIAPQPTERSSPYPWKPNSRIDVPVGISSRTGIPRKESEDGLVDTIQLFDLEIA